MATSYGNERAPASLAGEKDLRGPWAAPGVYGPAAPASESRLPSPVPLGQHDWPRQTAPLLSICSVTYNHAPFIRDCLDGFLMQETDFPVEIVIHDDASTDGTADSIREYANKYPKLFRPIYQTENQFSKGVKPLSQIVFPSERGRYIAVCDGDDYWTDPAKLQTQVDFLEAHPEYVLCYHEALMVTEDGRPIQKLNPPGDYTAAELMAGAWTLTATRCYRNVLTDYPNEVFRQISNGDMFVSILLGRHGRGKYLPQIRPAAYRQHAGATWSSLSEQDRYFELFNSYLHIYQYLLENDGRDVATEFLLRAILPNAVKIAPERNPLARRWDEQLRRKDEIIARAHGQLRDIQESASFRIGNTILWPVKRILAALRSFSGKAR